MPGILNILAGVRGAASGGSTTTWSPTNKASGVTLSPGNLTATGPATYGGYATAGISSGKFYYEAQFTNFGSIPRIGVCHSAWNVSTQELGDSANGISIRPDNGNVYYNGSNPATGLFTGTTSDRICVAWDYANHKIWFRKNNGSWDGTTDDPATNTGGYSNFTPSGTAYPAYEVNGATASVTVYFDSASWLYSAPSGFSALP